MKLFHNKKVVDEREQMEMFRVEHYMYWLAFWALLAGIFYQVIFMDASFGQVAGEWTVFMLMAVGLVIGDLAGGHFDYNGRPGWKYYLVSSLTAAAAVVGVRKLKREKREKQDEKNEGGGGRFHPHTPQKNRSPNKTGLRFSISLRQLRQPVQRHDHRRVRGRCLGGAVSCC